MRFQVLLKFYVKNYANIADFFFGLRNAAAGNMVMITVAGGRRSNKAIGANIQCID